MHGPATAAAARLAQAQRARDALVQGRSVSRHEEQVARLSALLADSLGLGSAHVEAIGCAAGLHDVGKLAVPDTVLVKPGPLSAREWRLVRNHAALGGAILSGHGQPVLDLAATIARSHHEAFDGTGYPDGLKGEAIPLEARIVAVADVYDALRQDRPYKGRMSHEEAIAVLRDGDGRISPAKFDGGILSAFLRIAPQVERIWEACAPASQGSRSASSR